VSIPATPTSIAYWTLSSTITLGNGSIGGASTINNVCIRGAGAGGLYGTYGSYFIWTGASNGTVFSINGPINNVTIEGINVNGGNLAATLWKFTSVRWLRFRNNYGAAFLTKGVDVEGAAATAQLNFMLDFEYNYITTTAANAIAVNFDGVLADNTDTWLSSFTNNRFESFGLGGIALRLGYSDNIVFSQLHAITTLAYVPTTQTVTFTSGSNQVTLTTPANIIVGELVNAPTVLPAGTKITACPGGNCAATGAYTLSNNATCSGGGCTVALQLLSSCGVLFDSSSGNSFPVGHEFIGPSIASTCTLEDATHTIGPSIFFGWGDTDNEVQPSHPKLRGFTHGNVVFGNTYNYTPPYTTVGLFIGTNYTGNNETSLFNTSPTAGLSFSFYQTLSSTTNLLLGYIWPSGMWEAGLTMKARGFLVKGSTPTLTNACTAGTQVGGETAGSFKLTAGCSGGSISVTFPTATAPNGWSCDAQDMTTPGALFKQTALSTTGVTLTNSGSAGANNDVIVFKCEGF
jgi:hypothetical protein